MIFYFDIMIFIINQRRPFLVSIEKGSDILLWNVL